MKNNWHAFENGREALRSERGVRSKHVEQFLASTGIEELQNCRIVKMIANKECNSLNRLNWIVR